VKLVRSEVVTATSSPTWSAVSRVAYYFNVIFQHKCWKNYVDLKIFHKNNPYYEKFHSEKYNLMNGYTTDTFEQAITREKIIALRIFGHAIRLHLVISKLVTYSFLKFLPDIGCFISLRVFSDTFTRCTTLDILQVINY